MRKLNFTSFLFLFFLFYQGMAGVIFLGKSSRFPLLSIERINSGSFALDFEKILSENVPAFKNSGMSYRIQKFNIFRSYNRTVKVSDSNRIFLSSRVEERPKTELNQVLRASKKVIQFKNDLSSIGKKLFVVIVPNRSYVYRDELYSSGHVPSVKAQILKRFVDQLRSNNVDVLALHSAFDNQPTAVRETLFYKGDHHWTYRGAEFASGQISLFVKDRINNFSDISIEKNEEGKWKTVKSKRKSLYSKLGFLKKNLPEMIERVEVPAVDQSQTKTRSKIFYISASYGEFGISNYLFNDLGLSVEERVYSGQGANYVVTSFVQEISSHPEILNESEGVIWLFPEYHLREQLFQDILFPTIIDITKNTKLDFHLLLNDKNVEKNKDINVLDNVELTVGLVEKEREIIIGINIKGVGKRSSIKCVETNQKYLISHHSEINYLSFRSSKEAINKFTFVIENHQVGRDSKKSIKLLGVYKDR